VRKDIKSISIEATQGGVGFYMTCDSIEHESISTRTMSQRPAVIMTSRKWIEIPDWLYPTTPVIDLHLHKLTHM
jgi:hypothetical protein